jgi:hypothetical protein
MKRRYVCGILGIVLLLAFSCKTTPKETEPESLTESVDVPVETETVTQAQLNTLNEARRRAETARQEAQNVHGPEYFPSDWSQADTRFAQTGRDIDTGNVQSVQNALTAYNELASAFEDITRRSLPLYAGAKREEVRSARQEAIDAGAFEIYPSQFYVADEKGEEVNTKIEAGDYYGAINAAPAALNYYTSLKLGSDAYNLREAILANNLAPYDQRDFDIAEENSLKALNTYDKDDISAVLGVVQEALNRYTQVWKTAWRSIASERRDAASVERRAALDLKANIAVKDEYNDAERVYGEAGSNYQAEQYEDAAERYARAAAMFTVVWETAEYKRQTADEAIRAAEQKVAESDQTAREAEIILGEGDEE